jgi:hypothetical protein
MTRDEAHAVVVNYGRYVQGSCLSLTLTNLSLLLGEVEKSEKDALNTFIYTLD